ncbi:AraC family transcriptional regulator [Pseudomonas sp. S25]|uniref:AraC family transcriptional regulator n=1 Tax=Pseudomonas maioricensis TaxID=1766623 RepID=A0ABS9ZPX7_9PSED|nr:AraC family transcriptional regulator [Pseudomonas sp. S25]MCI8212630.1 AraC family transcriptional regulator [Pseudomonas sp. S25]
MPRHQKPAPPLANAIVKDTISIELVREALLESRLPKDEQQALLAQAGIAPDVMGESRARVPVSAYAALWRSLERCTDDLFFGMDPRPLRKGSLEFLCRSSMAQPTLAEGLESGLAFLGLMLERFGARLIRQQSVAEIVIDHPQGAVSRAFADFTFWMIVHGVACWLCGRRVPILGIELRCVQPDYIEDYKVMFSENLRFQRPRSRMIFAADCLDLAIRRSTAELDAFLGTVPANLLVRYRDSQSLASRIRQYLRSLPAEQWPNSAELAQGLFMSGSTLRRRLAEEAQSYQALKDSVRKDLAIGWLADEQLDFTTIASRLGFADASSFHKAFRKWSGTNPGHYRDVVLGRIGQTGHPH